MAVILFTIWILASLQDVYGDACGSDATPITPFDLSEYLGIWHQIAVNKRFEEFYERNYPLCVYANYTLFTNNSVSVVNSGYNSEGDVDRAYGIATQPVANTGGLLVSFYGSTPGNYDIIKMIEKDNAYSIALVYSCDDGGLIEDLWILNDTQRAEFYVHGEMWRINGTNSNGTSIIIDDQQFYTQSLSALYDGGHDQDKIEYNDMYCFPGLTQIGQSLAFKLRIYQYDPDEGYETPLGYRSVDDG